jgi:hypothetical protein
MQVPTPESTTRMAGFGCDGMKMSGSEQNGIIESSAMKRLVFTCKAPTRLPPRQSVIRDWRAAGVVAVARRIILRNSGNGNRYHSDSGLELRMKRYTKPEKIHQFLLDQLGLTRISISRFEPIKSSNCESRVNSW